MSRTQAQNQQDLKKSNRELVKERDAAQLAFGNLARYIEQRGLEIRQVQSQAREMSLFLASLIHDMGGEVSLDTETMHAVASRGWEIQTDEDEDGEPIVRLVLGEIEATYEVGEIDDTAGVVVDGEVVDDGEQE